MNDISVILIPVYNDWKSLNGLLSGLNSVLAGFPSNVVVLIVDDGSTDKKEIKPVEEFTINTLHLTRNTGHQKAIAIGMAYLHDHKQFNRVLIMDADGEDLPSDAKKLLDASLRSPDNIILAKRKTRTEGAGFRFFYLLYKILFTLLTGKTITSGNFMVIPKHLLDKLVYYSEIWNHLSAAVLKSGLPVKTIDTDRGKRSEGNSKMSFGNLILHGFGAISVFIEKIAGRILILSVILILISVMAILIILFLKLFTNLAIPGWASSILSSMVILLVQGLLLSIFTLLLFLSSESNRKFIPAHHYRDYTSNTTS